MHDIQCYSDYTKYYPAAGVGWRDGGGRDSEALMDHEVKRTSGEPSCSLLQLGDLAGRSQQREEGGGGTRVGGCQTPPSMPYRSISSSSGVASPAMDMGVLSIMGLGDGRGVIL